MQLVTPLSWSGHAQKGSSKLAALAWGSSSRSPDALGCHEEQSAMCIRDSAPHRMVSLVLQIPHAQWGDPL